jgi:hypothetical protein
VARRLVAAMKQSENMRKTRLLSIDDAGMPALEQAERVHEQCAQL